MRNPPLAWRNVAHGGRRSVAAISGAAFSLVMVLLQLGFLQAVRITATNNFDVLDFDVLLTSARFEQFYAPGFLPLERLRQAQGVATVESATPLYATFALWRCPPSPLDAPPDDYLAACDGDLRGLRIGWAPTFGMEAIDPEVRQCTEAAARRFEELGARLELAEPTWEDPAPWHAVLYRAGIAARYSHQLRERPEWVDPSFALLIELGQRISARELLAAQGARTSFYDQARRFMDRFDLLLTPTMPCGAWSHERPAGEIAGRPITTVPGGRWPFMFPFNLTGWPAATVPCGFTSEGLPVGLQIVAPWHQDSRCLRASAAFEALQPWADRRPPLDQAATAPA